MKRAKAYRFRVYPDRGQDRLMRRTAGCCRLVYNLCRTQKSLEWHRSAPRRLSAFDQIKELRALKAEAPFLKAAPHHPLLQAVADLHKAYAAFFEGRAGYPAHKKKGEGDSFRFPDPKQFRVEADALKLPKLGRLVMRAHRAVEGVVKSVTLIRDGDHWYAALAVECEVEPPLVRNGPAVGIDVGVACPLALSDGSFVTLPKITATERERVNVLKRRLARKRAGSNNRERARRALARKEAHLRRRRTDAAHRATAAIVRDHGLVAVEKLKLANMTRSAKGTKEKPGTNVWQKAGLNRAILDVAPGQIARLLDYKLNWTGGTLIRVDPAYTSQTCSACGRRHPDSRAARKYICVFCGVEDHADTNAAKNILRRAATGGLPGMAWEASPTMGRHQEVMGAIP